MPRRLPVSIALHPRSPTPIPHFIYNSDAGPPACPADSWMHHRPTPGSLPWTCDYLIITCCDKVHPPHLPHTSHPLDSTISKSTSTASPILRGVAICTISPPDNPLKRSSFINSNRGKLARDIVCEYPSILQEHIGLALVFLALCALAPLPALITIVAI